MPSAPSSSKINVASLIASFLYDAFGETQNQVAFMVSSNLIWSTRGFTCHVLFFSSRLLCIFWSQNLQQYKYDCFNVETLRLVTCVCVCGCPPVPEHSWSMHNEHWWSLMYFHVFPIDLLLVLRRGRENMQVRFLQHVLIFVWFCWMSRLVTPQIRGIHFSGAMARTASTYALKQRQCYPSDLHHLSVMIRDDYVPEAHVRWVKWWQSLSVRSHQKSPVLGSPKSHFTFSQGPCYYKTVGGQCVEAKVRKHWMSWSPKRQAEGSDISDIRNLSWELEAEYLEA